MESRDDMILKRRLSKLKTNSKILSMLKDKRLKGILKKIDSSGNRYEELENELESNKNFNEFVYILMYTMKYYDNEGKYIDDDTN